MSGAGLSWTGHALFDVGTAGVCAFAKRGSPEDVTTEDLDRVGDFLVRSYYDGKLGPYLACVFPNASFVQPNEGKEKRQKFISQYLRAHRASAHPLVAGQLCVFSGQPATSPLFRTHLPLFSGEGVINFRPDGQTWVPAAGPFVVALLFLPMAGRRSEGKLLAVHGDDPALTIAFAKKHLDDNRRLLALPLPRERAVVHMGYESEIPAWDAQKKRYKFADAKGPRSLVLANLGEIARHHGPSDLPRAGIGLTGYLLSNAGQGPSLELFYVPAGITNFIAKAPQAPTAAAWEAVTRRFRVVKGDITDDKPQAGRPGWSINPAFEALCAIFDTGFLDRKAAHQWVSRFVLGRVGFNESAHRFEPNQARTWRLAELFLNEVIGMNPKRIDVIRAFADKLAAWIDRKNDQKLFNSLVRDRLQGVRSVLLRRQRESALEGALMFGLDEYANVWVREDEDDWFVRDLLCIRVVEKLDALGYFKREPGTAIENAEEQAEEEIQE